MSRSPVAICGIGKSSGIIHTGSIIAGALDKKRRPQPLLSPWEPAKDSSDGYPITDSTPPSSCPPFHDGKSRGPPFKGVLGPASLFRARVLWIVPSNRSPFGKGPGSVVEGGSISFRHDEADAVGWPYVRASERFRCALSTAFLSPSGPSVNARLEARYVSALLALLILRQDRRERFPRRQCALCIRLSRRRDRWRVRTAVSCT